MILNGIVRPPHTHTPLFPLALKAPPNTDASVILRYSPLFWQGLVVRVEDVSVFLPSPQPAYLESLEKRLFVITLRDPEMDRDWEDEVGMTSLESNDAPC